MLLALNPSNKLVSVPVTNAGVVTSGSTTPVPAKPQQASLRVNAQGQLILAP